MGTQAQLLRLCGVPGTGARTWAALRVTGNNRNSTQHAFTRTRTRTRTNDDAMRAKETARKRGRDSRFAHSCACAPTRRVTRDPSAKQRGNEGRCDTYEDVK